MTNILQTTTAQQFIVRQSGVSNVTGDGTTYTVVYDSLVQGSGIVIGTGIFTCTVPGNFLFSSYINFTNVPSASTASFSQIVTTKAGYQLCNFSPFGYRDASNNSSQGFYCVLPMSQGDTAYLNAQASNATKVVGVIAWFQGMRLF
jgi:hypothetical protein